MTKDTIQEWDATAANNTDIGGVNIAESCAPSGINNAIREHMAQIKTALSGADASLVTGTAGTDGNIIKWNADGDAVDSGVSSSVGVVLISTATISSDATVEFDSTVIDNSTYADFMFVLRHVEPATDGANLYVRISTDGGSTFVSGASAYVLVSINASTAGGPSSATNTSSEFNIFGSVGNDTGEDGVSGELHLLNPGSSLRTLLKADLVGRNNAGALFRNIPMCEAGSTVVNGIQFLFSTGNLASGEISVYGVRG